MELNLITGLGILFVAIGLCAFINNKIFAKMYNELKSGVYLLFLSGFTILFFGLFIIILNIPIDWKTWVVEVIGWLAILKGLVFIIFPSLPLKAYKKMLPSTITMIFLGIIALLLGLILLFF